MRVPDVSYARSGDVAVADQVIVEFVPSLGLSVRAGIHIGECERVGEKLRDLASPSRSAAITN